MTDEHERVRITQTLEESDYINIKLDNERLAKQDFASLFSLFAVLAEQKSFLEKFKGRMAINFALRQESDIASEDARTYVKRLCDGCHGLFFFLDKQTASLKNLTIAYCATGVADGDDYKLDAKVFREFLRQQLQEVVLLGAHHKLEPEAIEGEVKAVYDYFGIKESVL